MNYRAFSDYQLGYSHVKNGTVCEDCAMSYNEPNGKFYICVACDGHSDNNCFRSAKGARFGCESAVEILKRFLELYYEEEDREFTFSPKVEERLKKSIKQCWDNKVFQDIRENPLTEDELRPLTDKVRAIYTSGSGLQHIYGATFLAAALCEDFFVSLHIGDGIIMCIDENGTYYDPMPVDEKGEKGSPASLCDSDLFTRENAFRVEFTTKIPQAVIVSSDGVEDCMDELQYREFLRAVIEKFETLEQGESQELNETQRNYLANCLKYWADKGNGAEDDCSLAGIYDKNVSVPMVKIPLNMALDMWQRAVEERNRVVNDYEKRKEDMLNRIERQKMERASREQIENSKQVLFNIQKNEYDKLAYLEQKIKICEEYIIRANGVVPDDIALVTATRVEFKTQEADAHEEEVQQEDEQEIVEEEVVQVPEEEVEQKGQDEDNSDSPYKKMEEIKRRTLFAVLDFFNWR